MTQSSTPTTPLPENKSMPETTLPLAADEPTAYRTEAQKKIDDAKAAEAKTETKE